MNRGVVASIRQLGGDEVEPEAIGTRNQMDESFEVGSRDGPADRREAILVMEDRDISVQRVVSGVSDLTVNEEHFLVNLSSLISKWHSQCWLRELSSRGQLVHTQELSAIDTSLGA